MTGNAALALSVIGGLFLWAALFDSGKGKWVSFGAKFRRDKNGQVAIVLFPAKKKGRKR